MGLMDVPFTLSAEQCRFMADRAHKVSGVKVDPSKTEFIHLRVSRRLNALRLKSFAEYIDILKADGTGAETRFLVEALTTHTTSFFREKHQYDWLTTEGLQRIGETGAGFDRPLVVWSAACSTGAELWSAGMVLADTMRNPGGLRKFKLIGTDISRPILKKANGATYTEAETEGVSPSMRARYLMRSRNALDHGKRPYYRIVPELRQQASFEIANLSDLGALRDFGADIIFLRNVLIYFQGDLQEKVLNAVIDRLRPGGYLLTGHAEAVSSRPSLRAIGPSTYEKL